MSFSKELDYRTLYELSDPMAVEPFRLRSRLPGDASAEGVNVDLLARGAARIEKPIQFDAAQGVKATDFLWTQRIQPVCVSEWIIRILKANQVSGWSVYPVEVYDQEGKLRDGYRGLAVTGAACKPDYSRSAVIAKPPPTPRGKSVDVYRGLYFDEDQWDGSDMFWVGGVRVVVGKVKALFDQHYVENVKLTPLAEREIRVRHVRPQ